MKKLFISIMALAVMLCFAACSKPDEPVGTPDPTQQQTEAPTEKPTEKPTEIPTGDPDEKPTEEPMETPIPPRPETYDEHDCAVLRQFFESKRYTPLKNGEKLFPHYNPYDPASWNDFTQEHNMAVFWDEAGRVTGINLIVDEEADSIILYRELDLSALDKLQRFEVSRVYFEKIKAVDLPMFAHENHLSLDYIRAGEAEFSCAYIDEIDIWATRRLYFDMTGASGDGKERLPSFLVDITVEGDGSVTLNAYRSGKEYYYAELSAYGSDYSKFIGWFDEEGNLVSTDNVLVIYDQSFISEASERPEYRYTAKCEEAVRPTGTPTPEPTETPKPTEVPPETPAPTVMPTEVPAAARPIPGGDYLAVVYPDYPVIADIDGDGLDDIVLIRTNAATGYETKGYTVIITRGSDPDEPFTFETIREQYGIAVIADCDPSTPAKELIFGFFPNEHFMINAIRLKDDGSDFECFSHYAILYDEIVMLRGLPADYVYHASEGFPMLKWTPILGNWYVTGHFTVTSEGITLLADYMYDTQSASVVLERDMKLVGEDGKKFTARAGTSLRPYSTDMETYVKVILEDGTIGRAELSRKGDKVLINGVDQDKYAKWSEVYVGE